MCIGIVLRSFHNWPPLTLPLSRLGKQAVSPILLPNLTAWQPSLGCRISGCGIRTL